MAVIPLMSKHKVLGALNIFYKSTHEYHTQVKQMLNLVGNQLGAAIENAQLYVELKSQIERLSVLYELSQQLTSTLEIDRIFEIVSENTRRMIPYNKFTLQTYQQSQGTLTDAFVVDLGGEDRRSFSGRSQPARLDERTPEWDAISTRSTQRNSTGSSIYVPMLSKETILGLLIVQRNSEAPYSEIHTRLLESVGNLTAIALQKSELYNETLRNSVEIERRNKELDDFTYVVSHDLKEPLISVDGFSKILQSDYKDLIGEEGRDYLESIVGATGRMKRLIDDLLMLSRVSRPSISFKNVYVRDIIEEIKNDMEFTIRQRKARLIITEDLPTVCCNETHLKMVFTNLIANALKFNEKPEPVVEVGFQNTENNSYLFYVRDNGIGIPEEFREKIFVIFQRLHPREEFEGTGAGLAIVRKIIEMNQGRIWVESEPGGGSTFYFTLPATPLHE